MHSAIFCKVYEFVGNWIKSMDTLELLQYV